MLDEVLLWALQDSTGSQQAGRTEDLHFYQEVECERWDIGVLLWGSEVILIQKQA